MNRRFPFFVIFLVLSLGMFAWGLVVNEVKVFSPPSTEDLDKARSTGEPLLFLKDKATPITEVQATDWMSKERVIWLSDWLRSNGITEAEIQSFIPTSGDVLIDTGLEAFCYT